MPRTREGGVDRFRVERRKIQASGILDALIGYAEGRRDMSPSQVSAALGLLKKALPDLATLTLPDASDHRDDGKTTKSKEIIEIRIVDPQS